MQPDLKVKRKLGKDIHRLSNRIKRYMDANSDRQQLEAITGSNGWIIRFLSDHEDRDVYQKDLEAEFGITRSTASKVIRLMEQKGLVKRQGVLHDARLKKLTLTDKSRELSREMHQIGDAMDCRLLSGFAPEEISRLYDYIDRMMKNLD